MWSRSSISFFWKIESSSFFCNLNLESSSSFCFGFEFGSTLTHRSSISSEDSGNESGRFFYNLNLGSSSSFFLLVLDLDLDQHSHSGVLFHLRILGMSLIVFSAT